MDNRDKQIEKMEKIIQKRDDEAMYASIAHSLYNAGYRKASEVAREIIDDFDKHGVYSKEYTDFLRREYGIKENNENED